MKKNQIIITAVIALVLGPGGFFAGMKYQQSKTPSFNRQFANGQGQRAGGNANRNGFRSTNGEIISSDDKSITVKLADGSGRIVLFSDKTQINKAAIATKDDLKVGEKVAVFGTDNTDGSVTAQNIQLNPIIRN